MNHISWPEFTKAISAAVTTLCGAAAIGLQTGDWTSFLLALVAAAVTVYGVFKFKNKAPQ